MAEIVPLPQSQEHKADTPAAGSNENYTEAQNQTAHDALQPVREQVGGGSGEQRLERAGYVAPPENVDWKSELRQAVGHMRILQQLDGYSGPVEVGNGQYADADRLRVALIVDTDHRFQNALLAMQQDGGGAASTEMLDQILQAENVNGRMHALLNDRQVAGTLHDLGLDKKQLTADDIQNAILNAPTDNARNKLTEYFTLTELENATQRQVGESMLKAKAPALLSLAYAEFLMENTNGVTIDQSTGNVVSARDILLSANYRNPDMAAHPDAQATLQRASDQQVQNQAQLVPGGKNPIAMLQYALHSGDLGTFQQAYQLAQDKQFDPAAVHKQLEEVQKEKPSPQRTQKLAALQDLSHARALTEGFLGVAMLQQPNADVKTAMDHITNAMADPTVVTSIQDGRGNALLPQAMQQAIFMQNPDFQGWAKTFNTDMQSVVAAGPKIQAEGDKAGADLKNAIASAQDAYNKAELMQKALGPNAEKIEKEYDALKSKKNPTAEEKVTLNALQPFHDALHYKTQAAAMLATFDLSNGDFYAAKKLADEAAKDKSFLDDPQNAKFKQQVDAIQQESASKIHDIEESKKPWYERAWDTACSLPGKAWDFVKNHAKLVAAAVGFAAAIAITVGTGGLGAPAGVAIVAGIAGGGLLGASAGGGLEVANGKAKNFWQGFKDTAPSAFQGSAIGATLVGFAPAAAGAAAEGGAATAGTEAAATAGTEAAATGAGAAEATAEATANVGRVAQLTERLGQVAKSVPGVDRAIEGANAVRNSELVTNYMANGRVMTFANMSNPLAANMARFGTIAAISGVPANWDSLRKGQVLPYANYVATGSLFGLGGKVFLAADAGKNAVMEAGNPHGDNYGAGAYLRNVMLDTGGDSLAKFGARITPGGTSFASGIYGSLYPAFAEQSRDANNQLYHVGETMFDNHVLHRLSDYEIRNMNLTPEQVKAANDYLAHGDQPQQPQPAPTQPDQSQYVTDGGVQQQPVQPAADTQVQGDPGSASYYQQYLNDNNH